jgi:hypothetical protein
VLSKVSMRCSPKAIGDWLQVGLGLGSLSPFGHLLALPGSIVEVLLRMLDGGFAATKKWEKERKPSEMNSSSSGRIGCIIPPFFYETSRLLRI